MGNTGEDSDEALAPPPPHRSDGGKWYGTVAVRRSNGGCEWGRFGACPSPEDPRCVSWIRNVDDGVEDGGNESGELVIIKGVESSPVK